MSENEFEMLALAAIKDALTHTKSLYTILLTDGDCCSKLYKYDVGLNELDIIIQKINKRMAFLDDEI